MRKFDDETGQLILIACVTVALAIVLITSYEYSTLVTGEKSINRENMDSTYYYQDVRERYINIYDKSEYLNYSKPINLTVFENEMKDLAILHGYSIDFIHNDNGSKTTIVFVDKDIRIEEELPEV
ncbi:MAG: hypothetical protein HF976_13430 [ANME-2 cluster archaeon]|nr:hypothetical protein [ANME-2 cluster archaeon]MBC2702379.1 hypothetical protein [ANME-2 cluster archaeon]MBC2708616.1 hypothetical protein [ANME-2 cluster archaeon]MBC2745829.1 hypothetical protein [ANME-2 cluster archaeon]MBC2764250.1 hypothetical protein [ANME-2 cluster archaeon]